MDVSYTGYAFVDWDDTIAENIRYFRKIEEEVTETIASLTGFPPEEVHRRGEEIDVAVSRRMGLVTASFGVAWAECYREFCARAGVSPKDQVEEEIRQACLHPYRVKQDLHPGSGDVLAWLCASGFEVTIWTAGDREVQERKIEESGLGEWIDRREVVPQKDEEALRTALGARDPGLSFVIGNSLHSDVQPALGLGMLAVHIKVDTWAYDEVEVDIDDPNYVAIADIRQAPQVIADRFKGVSLPEFPHAQEVREGWGA